MTIKVSKTKPENKQTGTLGKLMTVLETVAYSDQPMRFTDLLNACDQPRGTLHRQVSHLLEEDLLEQKADGSYTLGMQLLKLASLTWSKNSEREICSHYLQDLFNKTGCTIHLAAIRNNMVTYLDKVESSSTLRIHSTIGNVAPTYCTGVGKAMLSAFPEAELDAILDDIEFQRFTENTIYQKDALEKELEKIRQQGFSEDNEEHEAGIYCVAAPILNLEKKPIFAISVTSALFRLEPEDKENYKRWVMETASKLGDELSIKLGPRS